VEGREKGEKEYFLPTTQETNMLQKEQILSQNSNIWRQKSNILPRFKINQFLYQLNVPTLYEKNSTLTQRTDTGASKNALHSSRNVFPRLRLHAVRETDKVGSKHAGPCLPSSTPAQDYRDVA